MHNTNDGFFGRQINISLSPWIAIINENASISGFIIPPQANVEVTILYRREGETDWRTLTTTTTDEQGNYLYVWQPQEVGIYDIRTTAIIEGTKETSSSVFLTVKTSEHPLWQYINLIIAVIIIIAGITATVIYRKNIQKRKKNPARTA